MSVRSKIETTLPPDVRGELDRRIIDGSFAGYDNLAEWLLDSGFEISRSAIGRYGKGLKEKLDGLRDKARLAHAITEQFRGEDNKMSEASLSMAESQILDVLYFLHEADEETDPTERLKLLRIAGGTLADLARAGVTVKRWAEEQRVKASAAAETVTTLARSSGLSDELIDTFRSEILGIAR